jgi:hypothetical protein
MASRQVALLVEVNSGDSAYARQAVVVVDGALLLRQRFWAVDQKYPS